MASSVDISKLLALPKKTRREIVEKLWDSLHTEKNEDKKVVALLEKRWKDIKSGRSATSSSESFWGEMETHLQQKGK